MFTPLSKGSERAQHSLWDHGNSPRRTKPGRGLSVGLSPTTSPRKTASPAAVARDGHGKPPSRAERTVPSALASANTPGPGHARLRSATLRSARGMRRHSVAEVEESARAWYHLFLRPPRKTVDGWLSSFWKRHFVLVLLPCILVWVWVALPFPVNDPYKDNPFPDIPFPGRQKDGTGGTGRSDDDDGEILPLDVNFYFFLFWYFGGYLAVALFFITNLFSLYRLNWWPSVLGGKISYALSWGATLLIGLASHHLDLFNLRERWRSKHPEDDVDWERKTFWVGLSFLAMLMPAIACFSKLKKDKRHKYRNSMPGLSSLVFGDNFSNRFPASWRRFLWFMTCLSIACFSVMAGQAYASLFLSTLPHTSLDAGTWVYSWVITVQLLAGVSLFILAGKVRSRALLFLYKLFFQLVYHVFYRNLFARLRSPTQFATVQLLSSISVVIIFPLQMTRVYHRCLQVLLGYAQSWEEHVDNTATAFYCRGLAQNVTMVGFLGWLSILHFGPNSQIYPFFKFDPKPDDPYTFPLTFYASCAIWGSELISSFVARQVMVWCFGVDVTQIGLDEMREYPELVPACGWASVHVSMNILLFLIKLNFR